MCLPVDKSKFVFIIFDSSVIIETEQLWHSNFESCKIINEYIFLFIVFQLSHIRLVELFAIWRCDVYVENNLQKIPELLKSSDIPV